MVLSLLEAGEMRLNAAPGEHQRVTAGMLGMYAPRQDACYRWDDGARQTYLALPRSVVVDALGREPDTRPRQGLCRAIPLPDHDRSRCRSGRSGGRCLHRADTAVEPSRCFGLVP